MSAGGLFLRLITFVVLGVGVFLASMAITILLRNGQVSASTLSTESPPTSIEPILSAEPVVVVTTTPSTQPVVTTTTTIVIPIAIPAQPLPELDEVFSPLVDPLGTELVVPVRLPAEFESEIGELTATGDISAGGYVIHIDRATDCDETTCRVATFTARQSTLSDPSLGLAGTAVPLPNGLTGRFTDGTCGELCNNAFITWIEDGVRYSVGSNVISGTDVLDLAWRSIDGSLPAPTGPQVCGPNKPAHAGQVATVLTTDVPTGDSSVPVNWIAVCSALGTGVEIIEDDGGVRWVDVDRNGEHDLVVTHDDGASTLFVVDVNRPRAVIDLRTSWRLRVGELACASIDGQQNTIDVSTNEILEFVGPLTVRRVAFESWDHGSFRFC